MSMVSLNVHNVYFVYYSVLDAQEELGFLQIY